MVENAFLIWEYIKARKCSFGKVAFVFRQLFAGPVISRPAVLVTRWLLQWIGRRRYCPWLRQNLLQPTGWTLVQFLQVKVPRHPGRYTGEYSNAGNTKRCVRATGN